MFTDQALDADADQGTAVQLLTARDQHEAADLLEVATMTYTTGEDDFGGPWVTVDVGADPTLYDTYTDDVQSQIFDVFHATLLATGVRLNHVRVYPRRVEGDWREQRRKGRLTGITNHATLVPLPEQHPRKDGFHFRDPAEVNVYEGLLRLQQTLLPETTILVAPNCLARLPGRAREVDFLVTYQGKVGAIDVDGSTHHKRYAADQSRDQLLVDAGVAIVERIVAEDTNKPEEVDQFLKRFVRRLTR